MRNLFLILSAFLSAVCFSQTRDRYDLLVDSLTKKGQSDKIIPLLQKELKAHPRDENLLRWLGRTCISQGKLDEGEKYYNDAIALNPKCGRCYMNIGAAYAARKDRRKALEYLDRAVSVDPKDGQLYATRGRFKESMGDKFGSLMDYNKAVELEPGNYENYIMRAGYNERAGYFSIALSDINKAVELAPGNYLPYFNRASLYYGKRMTKEAMEDISKAISLDSTKEELYTGRGAIYSMLGEYDKSMSDYSKAIALNPGRYIPYINRAQVNYQKEDMDASCADYATALRLLKETGSGDSTEILELKASMANHCDPEKPSYYYQRGIAYYNLKQFDKSVAAYTDGLKKFPSNSMSYSFRGNAYLALKEYEKAIADYTMAASNKDNVMADVKASPNYGNSSAEEINNYVQGYLATMQVSIAEALFALGRYEDALKEINKGIEIAPDIKEYGKENYYHIRGTIYLGMGKYDLAMKDFDKCVLLNPNFPEAYPNRAVTKAILASRAKVTSNTTFVGVQNPLFSANWAFPAKTTFKNTDDNIISALKDCDKAIALADSYAYAYYIRAQIKKGAGRADYCIDFLKAKELGQEVEQEHLRDCLH